jgi:uncharacterized protein YdhG (YjbR/CyaY superfamily)
MSDKQKLTTIDEYIALASPEAQPILQTIRKMAQEIVPAAAETISYQLPAFKTNRTFFYFAAFKKHIGIYPPVKDDHDLIEALSPYRGEKGNLQFPLSQPMPYELIGRVIKALFDQYSKR